MRLAIILNFKKMFTISPEKTAILIIAFCFNLFWSGNVFAGDLVWKKLPDMPVEKWEAGTTILDDKLYLFGGYTKGVTSSKIVTVGGQYHHDSAQLDQAWVDIYDPKTNSWSTGPSLPKGHSPAAAIIDGKLYVGGGSRTGATIEAEMWATDVDH